MSFTAELKAFAVHNGWTRLVVLCFGDPHCLES